MKIESKFKTKNLKSSFGFTLIEIIIVVSLIALFVFLVTPFGLDFYREQVLEESTISIADKLKLAQSRALSEKNNSSWGVRFIHEEGKYVLFQGDSYDQRDSDYDQEFTLPSGMTIEGINEIVYEKGTGDPYMTVYE